MKEEENSNDTGNAMDPERPIPIPSGLLKLWSVFFEIVGQDEKQGNKLERQ